MRGAENKPCAACRPPKLNFYIVSRGIYMALAALIFYNLFERFRRSGGAAGLSRLRGAPSPSRRNICRTQRPTQQQIEGEDRMKTFQKDELAVKILPTREELGRVAAADFAAAVRQLLAQKESIRVIFAAAPSQNEFLAAAVADESIDFSRVEAFHMDEYIGLAPQAPQGFGNFLRERIFARRTFRAVHYLDGQNPDPQAACASYAALLNERPIDIVCMGIGENGHIAFNDPSVADFHDPQTVKVVQLEEVCRMQQVHDGCFSRLADVPTHAMTLTVPALMKSALRFCMAPARTKANAARDMLEGPIGEQCPCTILRRTPGSYLYLDADSSALLS